MDVCNFIYWILHLYPEFFSEVCSGNNARFLLNPTFVSYIQRKVFLVLCDEEQRAQKHETWMKFRYIYDRGSRGYIMALVIVFHQQKVLKVYKKEWHWKYGNHESIICSCENVFCLCNKTYVLVFICRNLSFWDFCMYRLSFKKDNKFSSFLKNLEVQI